LLKNCILHFQLCPNFPQKKSDLRRVLGSELSIQSFYFLWLQLLSEQVGLKDNDLQKEFWIQKSKLTIQSDYFFLDAVFE
jgi:hypothetical protein